MTKNILITGSSKGIGEYLTNKLLAEGHSVHGISRSAGKITHANYRHTACDLGNVDELKKAAEVLKKDKVDVFIHNAGIHGPIGTFGTLDMDQWIKCFNVNLISGALLLDAVINSLRANKGSAIFLAGGGSTAAMKNFSSYSVSKTAVVRFCENMAVEYANEVKFYCVSPGAIDTDLLKNAIKHGDQVPANRILSLDHPWNLCRFLIDNEDFSLSGRQIHVKDDYTTWSQQALGPDDYKLRRITPATPPKPV